MRCEDVRRVLPLQSDTPGAEAEGVVVHLKGCAECRELHEGYLADEQALAASRAAPRELPAVMDGFTAAVMAATVSAPRAEGPEGRVLRPVFGAGSWIAVAALTLLAVGLGLLLGGATGSGEQRPTASRGGAPEELAPVVPVAEAPEAQPLPAPRRAQELAPTPRLSRRGPRRGIVPVDGGRGPQLPSGPLFDVLRDMQRALPGLPDLDPVDHRVPPLRPGEREVRF